MRRKARLFALQNAVLHGSEPEPGPVMGRIMADRPDLRSRAKEVNQVVREAIAGVKAMDTASRRAALEKEAPELLVVEKKDETHVLPPLPGAVDGQVVMRLAPYPSGPLHIGNARMVILNDEYVRRHSGKMLLVFDDTAGSEEKFPVLEAYDLIRGALKWMGVKIADEVYKSDRLKLFYEHARKILTAGNAYVCKCPGDEVKRRRDAGEECAHRAQSVEENLSDWEKMLSGEYAEGSAIVRLKTDMRHKNPAFRDRVLLRISTRAHPRVGTKYRVWPMLEFSWAVDDQELGITHVVRGKDLVIEDEMERFIWALEGAKRDVHFSHFGILRVAEAKLSKSKSRSDVMSGQYKGWHDPRTWSIQSLEKRGIRPEALRRFILSFGMSMQDIEVPAENLYAENRKLVDDDANRYFFVEDPQPLEIHNDSQMNAHPPRHPDHPERGTRTHHLAPKGGKLTVSITPKDLPLLQNDVKIRLKDLGNFLIKTTPTGPTAHYIGNDIGILKQGARIIHWCPPDARPCRVIMPDGTEITGVVEAEAWKEVGKVVQFERFGFVRIDMPGTELLCYYAHP
ncbi:MAG: glutamate--tRNA ligase [Euryarchaeota archaeon]|nr:glutamate--tRNA ligase [Euryarchaeota archaeon]